MTVLIPPRQVQLRRRPPSQLRRRDGGSRAAPPRARPALLPDVVVDRPQPRPRLLVAPRQVLGQIRGEDDGPVADALQPAQQHHPLRASVCTLRSRPPPLPVNCGFGRPARAPGGRLVDGPVEPAHCPQPSRDVPAAVAARRPPTAADREVDRPPRAHAVPRRSGSPTGRCRRPAPPRAAGPPGCGRCRGRPARCRAGRSAAQAGMYGRCRAPVATTTWAALRTPRPRSAPGSRRRSGRARPRSPARPRAPGAPNDRA